MPPLVIAGLALAGAKIVKGLFDKNSANGINPQYTPYQVSPYAEQQLATARQMFNGRMAGAATEERNIDTSQAAYNKFLERNANSGAQALAMAATGQARANEAYSNLGMKEQQNKYGLMANLNAAYGAMTAENEKVYESKLQKYYMDTNQKRALNNAGDQNIFGGASDAVSLGMQYMASLPTKDLDAPQLSTVNNRAYVAPFQYQNVGGVQNPVSSPAAASGYYIPQSGGLQLWYPPLAQR